MIKRPRLDDITSLLATLNPPFTIYLSTMADGSWSYTQTYTEGAEKVQVNTSSPKHLRKIVKRALDNLERRLHDNKQTKVKYRPGSRTEDYDDTGFN